MDFLQRKPVRLMFVFFLVGVAALSAVAQTSTTGFIVGTVKDPTGAVVAGATVVASSPTSIRSQSATTGNDGSFSIFNLPPGKYAVTVEHQGFSKYLQNNIDVNLGRSTAVEIKLEIGADVDRNHGQRTGSRGGRGIHDFRVDGEQRPVLLLPDRSYSAGPLQHRPDGHAFGFA